MDPGALGTFQRFGCGVDILVDSACERADHGVVSRQCTDALDALEITRARDGEARLDDVHLESEELPGESEFLLGVHARAR